MATDILKAFEPLFYPKSLAVIGASSDMTKFGNIILSAFMEIGYKGKVYPVNPEAEEINGLKGYPSLKEIPGEVDFAVLTIPAPLVSSTLEESLRKGVKGVEILTSGFRETGTPEGRRMEEEITRIAKRGIRILGPNCFGIYCPESGLTILPGQNFSRETGPVGLPVRSKPTHALRSLRSIRYASITTNTCPCVLSSSCLRLKGLWVLGIAPKHLR